MDKDTAKRDIEIGKRIKDRRTELKLSQEKLGSALGVNKSTIQRYESQGVDPDKAMILSSLADELETTVEWLKGESDEKNTYEFKGLKRKVEKSLDTYLDTLCNSLDGVIRDAMLNYLIESIDMSSLFNKYLAKALEKIDDAKSDNTVADVLNKYEISTDIIYDKVYKKEVEDIIADMHKMIDNLYNMFENGLEGFSNFTSIDKIKNNAIKKYEDTYNSVDIES